MTTEAIATARDPEANGTPEPLGVGSLEYAIRYEETIAEEAKLIWEGDEDERRTQLDAHLLRQLRPLLRRPIPQAFIEEVGEVSGKPYSSIGIKSVQVQMDRLDNVLGPENWGYEATHTDDGRRCYVRAWVGHHNALAGGMPLVARDSWGGVNRGSTEGNLWKGSFTNAAKVALARLGPGWEIYVGAADFDPDTDEAAAEAQQAGGEEPLDSTSRPLPPEKVGPLAKAVNDAGKGGFLAGKLRSFGVKDIADLTVEQAVHLWEWTQKPAGGESA